jgi:hypothetical protein
MEKTINWMELLKDIGIRPFSIYVKYNKNNHVGVFAGKDFNNGDLIEHCLGISPDFRMKYAFSDNRLAKYCLPISCHEDEQEICKEYGERLMILLGNGSIYNASKTQEESNADIFISQKAGIASFYAKKDIKKDEEILVCRGESYYNYFYEKNK